MNKRINNMIVVIVLIVISTSINCWTESTQSIAKKAFASTVLLIMKDVNDKPIALASGFIVSENSVVTNYHVIQGASKGTAKPIGKDITYNINAIIAIDPFNDLALLSIDLKSEIPLTLGDSQILQIGDNVYVAGNPLGLEGTFSQGIVSGFRTLERGKIIQITAPISQGSSGGPVFNDFGDVVGIAVATIEGGQNLNFAIPINYLKVLINEITSPIQVWRSDYVRQHGDKEYRYNDIGPAGGVIFYDKGDYQYGWRYLEAAPWRIAEFAVWNNFECIDINTDTAIGSGRINTYKIVAAHGPGRYAALVCLKSDQKGFKDWFLPSKDELELLLANSKIRKQEGGPLLWSSSQYNMRLAWFSYFGSEHFWYTDKKADMQVLAIRAF